MRPKLDQSHRGSTTESIARIAAQSETAGYRTCESHDWRDAQQAQRSEADHFRVMELELAPAAIATPFKLGSDMNHLHRRQILRAAGVCIGLPFFSSLGTTHAGHDKPKLETTAKKRMVCIGNMLGFHPEAFWAEAAVAAPKNRNMVEDLPLLYDLIALSLQTDSTRIVTLKIGCDVNPRDLGVNGD